MFQISPTEAWLSDFIYISIRMQLTRKTKTTPFYFIGAPARLTLPRSFFLSLVIFFFLFGFLKVLLDIIHESEDIISSDPTRSSTTGSSSEESSSSSPEASPN